MQNSLYIISNKEKKTLIQNIQFMINKIQNKRNNTNSRYIKSGGGTDVSDNSDDDDSSNEHSSINNVTNDDIGEDNVKHKNIKNNGIYKPKLNLNRLFFGPLAVDLTHSKILPINKYNLNNDFVNTNNNIRLNSFSYR